MSDSSEALHAAIRAALVADATTAALIQSRVYDKVPDQATGYPYVQLTPILAGPYDAVDTEGSEVLFRVDIEDRKNGQTGRAHSVAKAVRKVLHDSNLTVSGHHFVNGRLLDGGQRLLRDPDGISVAIQQRYRFVTHEA